jgi:hypothetical protein
MAAGPEDILQITVARFLKVAAPDLLWWHTPNGGTRRIGEARKFQDMGVRPGVPDMTFILPVGLVAFIELKAGKNGLEPSQRIFAEEAIARGAAWALCRSLEEVETTLRGWGVNLRARAQ